VKSAINHIGNSCIHVLIIVVCAVRSLNGIFLAGRTLKSLNETMKYHRRSVRSTTLRRDGRVLHVHIPSLAGDKGTAYS
jgi:hypothetical protein